MAESNGKLNEEFIDSIEDLQTFPVQVVDVSTGMGSTRRSGAGQLGQVAERTIRDILGWRPKSHDSKGFNSALDQAFTSRDVDGTTRWTWRQRGFTVRADLGAITGAQASIYTSARTTLLDQSIGLLDGLTPLRADADPEDTEAIRSIVRDQITQLVDELGVEGGPVVQHVDQLLGLLIEYDPHAPAQFVGAETIGGNLGVLGGRFGLQRYRVNTIEEEHNLTNFITLADQITGVMLTWHAQRESFSRNGTDVFLGTQLIQLNRALEVVVESVHEVESAMDSVFIGADERQTLELPFDPPMTVAELLDWIERFASEDGPRTIKESGKDGVIHDFRPKMETLSALVTEVAELATSPADKTLLAGFQTPRVRFAFRQLDAHMKTAEHLTDGINRGRAVLKERPRRRAWVLAQEEVSSAVAKPGHDKATIVAAPGSVIHTVVPATGQSGTRVTANLSGDSLEPGSRLRLTRAGEPDVVASAPSNWEPETKTLSVEFDLTNARAGTWQLVVDNPIGSSAAWPDFEVTEPAQPTTESPGTQVLPRGKPQLTAVEAGNLKIASGTIDLLLTGELFRTDKRESFTIALHSIDLKPKQRVACNGFATVEPGSRVHAWFNQATLQAGKWELRVNNKGLGGAAWPNPIVIEA